MNTKLNKKTLLNQLPTVVMIIAFSLTGSSNLHHVAVLSSVGVVAVLVMMPLAAISKIAARNIKNHTNRAIVFTAIVTTSILTFLVALASLALAIVDLIGSHTMAISVFGWVIVAACAIMIIAKVVEQHNNAPLRRHQKNVEALRSLSRDRTWLSASR